MTLSHENRFGGFFLFGLVFLKRLPIDLLKRPKLEN